MAKNLEPTAQTIFMSWASEHFTLKLLLFYDLNVKNIIYQFSSVALLGNPFLFSYIKGILEDRLGLGKTSVIYQDIVDTSRGPTDIKMPHSSTPEFRAVGESETPLL